MDGIGFKLIGGDGVTPFDLYSMKGSFKIDGYKSDEIRIFVSDTGMISARAVVEGASHLLFEGIGDE